MKKFLIVFFGFILLTPTIYSQEELIRWDVYGIASDKEFLTGFDMKNRSFLSDNLLLTYSLYCDPYLFGTDIGLSYFLSESLILGFGGGIDNMPKLFHFSANLWFGNEKFSGFSYFRKWAGEDNYIYRSSLRYQLEDCFSIGLSAWRFRGVGPEFRFYNKKRNANFFIIPSYDFESENLKVIAGLSFIID